MKPSVVVDIVQTEITTTNNQPFHGLFNEKFPERCWISDNRIVLSTPQKYTVKPYVINIGNTTIVHTQVTHEVFIDLFL